MKGEPMNLGEVKAYLRIDSAGEDALIARLIGSAVALCEAFVGQWLIRREAQDVLPVSAQWQRLAARPVVAIDSVTGIPAEGAEFALGVGAYAIDIDRNGDGWVRVTQPGSAGRVRVQYRAGIAEDEAGVPEAIRQGIVRMAAQDHAQRDGGAVAVPAIVTALWRPWRRMRLK